LSGVLIVGGLIGLLLGGNFGETSFGLEDVGVSMPDFDEFLRNGLNRDNRLPEEGLRMGGEAESVEIDPSEGSIFCRSEVLC
jgi:hypothetical protein